MSSARRLPVDYNVSTYGDGTRDYSVFATWEAATDNDLVTATAGEVLECYDDSASFDDSIDMAGATGNVNYFRVIKPAGVRGEASWQGHDGTPNVGVYFETTDLNTIKINETYSQVQDLVAKTTATGTNNRMVFEAWGQYTAIVGCIAVDSSSTGSGEVSGFRSFPSGGEIYFINCMAINCQFGYYSLGTYIKYIYNCIFTGCGVALDNRGGTHYDTNTLLYDNTTNYSGTWNSTTNWEAVVDPFVDSASDDYSLVENRIGTSLVADGSYAFDDDINGVIRTSWTAGSFDNKNARRFPVEYNTSTYGDGTRDYTALATWEAATDNDLVTAEAGEILDCYDDAASFDDQLYAAGSTTSTSYFRVIKPAGIRGTPTWEGHNGTPNNGVFFDTAYLGTAFLLDENYFGAYDLILKNYVSSAAGRQGLATTNGTGVRSIGNIFFECLNPGTGVSRALNLSSANICFAIDNLIIGCDLGINNDDAVHIFYNNTLVSCNVAFTNAYGSSAEDTNSILYDNSTNYSGTWTSTTNLEAVVDPFVDSASDDYHLASSDDRNGTDLDSDTSYAFDNDLDDVLWTNGSWGRGALTYIPSLALNEIDWNNIASINGILKANISSVNTVDV